MKVRRRLFWGIQTAPNGKKLVISFATEKDRDCWALYSINGLTACFGPNHGITREPLDAKSPIVRKLNRMMSSGEQITFPIEVD